MKINRISECLGKYDNYFEKFNIDDLWKKIMEGKDFIYQNTYLMLEGNKAIVYADDNAVLMALNMQKTKLFSDIKKKLTDIKALDLRITNKKIVKKNVEEDEIVEKEKISKNFEEIKKRMFEKYSYIEDEETKKIYVAYAIQKELKDIDRKNSGAVKCIECKEYFLRVAKENVCILCRNKKYDRDIEFVKQKIYSEPEITSEYIKKIFGISKSIYGHAISQILDDKMLNIYYKIEQNLDRDYIDLSKELEEYAMYYSGSRDPKILDIIIRRQKDRLTRNVFKIYNKGIYIIIR
ncbi:MAG: hypothetical protein CR959_00380 [Fusobacteriales bacterium]|nr:MAG: hypothetical protein CR959_00380 [Fusobacteriales bacterium]